MKADAVELRIPVAQVGDRHNFGSLGPWVAGAVMTLAALWLHLTLLAHGGALWRDEVNLVNLAALPGLSGLKQDSFPVAMPLAVRAWSVLGLGKTDFGLRCLGVLAGLGLLAAYWTNSWSARRAAPLLSLTLLALNPVALTYGDSLRAYGLGSLLIVLAAGATWRFLAEASLGHFWWMAALMTASVQTLFPNAVLVGAICAGALAVCLSTRAYREALLVFAAGLIAAVSLLPYRLAIASALDPAAGWRTGFRPWFAWLDLRRATAFPRDAYLIFWALLIVLTVILGMRGFAGLWSQRGHTDKLKVQVFAAGTLAGALGGFGWFIWSSGLDTQPWYFLPLLALAVTCLDLALAPDHRYLKVALAAFAVGTALSAFPLARAEMMQRFTNVDAIADLLRAEAGPEDYVVVSPWFCGITFARYYHGPAAWQTLPPLEDHRVHHFEAVNAQMRHPDVLQPVMERLAATLRTGHRVWLVGSVEIPPAGQAPPVSLGPPPLRGWGWSQAPYIINWNDQVEVFLRANSGEFEMISIPSAGDVNANENLKLARAAGWK